MAKDCKRIADDPNAFFILGGDSIDAIARKNDKRASQGSLAAWCARVDDVVRAELDRFEYYVTPIAAKCLMILQGNHEADLLEYANRDVYAEEIAIIGRAQGKQPNEWHRIAPGWEGFLDLRFRYNPPGGNRATRTAGNMGHNWRFVTYAHHGAGGGRKAGGHALTLESAMGNYGADLVLMGHRHVRQAVERDLVVPDAKRGYAIRQRWGAFGGAYLGAYIADGDDGQAIHNYPQRKGLPARATGGIVVDIRPFDREFVIVLNSKVEH